MTQTAAYASATRISTADQPKTGGREESVRDVGRREAKQQRQAGAAPQQGMQAVAAQQRTGVVGRGMAHGRLWIAPPTGQDK